MTKARSRKDWWPDEIEYTREFATRLLDYAELSGAAQVVLAMLDGDFRGLGPPLTPGFPPPAKLSKEWKARQLGFVFGRLYQGYLDLQEERVGRRKRAGLQKKQRISELVDAEEKRLDVEEDTFVGRHRTKARENVAHELKRSVDAVTEADVTWRRRAAGRCFRIVMPPKKT